MTEHLPIWSPAAIAFLQPLLSKEMTGLEWSSGHSTVWLAERLKEIYSVEHDPIWLAKTKEWLSDQTLNNAVVGYLPPKWLTPRQRPANVYCSVLGHTLSFENYVRYPLTLAKRFDFIGVDGRCRVKCLEIVSQIDKPGTILLIDNSERERYQKGLKGLAGYTLIHQSEGEANKVRWVTSIYRRDQSTRNILQ